VWADFYHYWLSDHRFGDSTDSNLNLFTSTKASAKTSQVPLYSNHDKYDDDNDDGDSSSCSCSSDSDDGAPELVNTKVPTLVVRYEDLLASPTETMQTITAFLATGQPPSPQCRLKKKQSLPHHIVSVDQSVTPTPLQSKNNNSSSLFRSDSACTITGNADNSESKSPGYQPKSGGMGKGLRRMDARLIRDVLKTPRMKKYLKLFGYNVSPSPTTTATAATTTSSTVLHGSKKTESSLHSYQISLKPSKVSTISGNTNTTSADQIKGILINDVFSIRSPDDPFGRNFTYTRHEITDNDTVPLPTVSRMK
jgi:hypothetical protein